MAYQKRLNQLVETAKTVQFDHRSKIVLMSDCHRGDGSGSDNFLKNQNLYYAALSHYYDAGFLYIELGDGDELWENKHMEDITAAHYRSLELIRKFHYSGRFHMLYGNHDMVKGKPKWVERHLFTLYSDRKKVEESLFQDIQVHESILLQHRSRPLELFLIHGHQVDPLNYNFWRVARFLVRYVWRPLELVGITDPGSAQKNHRKKLKIERRLMRWTGRQQRLLVAGHTHRTVFPRPGEAAYFNDGCCVHPRCITAIEIEQDRISLVEWKVCTRKSGTLYVDREILEGPAEISSFFQEID